MVTSISKTKVDQLGDRLRKGHLTDENLALLDDTGDRLMTRMKLLLGNSQGIETGTDWSPLKVHDVNHRKAAARKHSFKPDSGYSWLSPDRAGRRRARTVNKSINQTLSKQ